MPEDETRSQGRFRRYSFRRVQAIGNLLLVSSRSFQSQSFYILKEGKKGEKDRSTTTKNNFEITLEDGGRVPHGRKSN